MPKSYYEFKDKTSSKFWEIDPKGSTVTVRYGKIGTDGQTTVKRFGSAAAASAHAAKVTAEKVKKGYKAPEKVIRGVSKVKPSKPVARKPKEKSVETLGVIKHGEPEIYICLHDGWESVEQGADAIVCAVFSIDTEGDQGLDKYSLVYGYAGGGIQSDWLFKYFGPHIAFGDSGGGFTGARGWSNDEDAFSEEVSAPAWEAKDEQWLEALRGIAGQYLEYSDQADAFVVRSKAMQSLGVSEVTVKGCVAYSSEGFDDEMLRNFSSIWDLHVAFSPQ